MNSNQPTRCKPFPNDFGGQLLALRRDGVRYYLHQDRLGSLMIATAGNTGNSGDQGFYAYGRLRRGSVGVERGFTGQHQDATGLLYDYGIRSYDPPGAPRAQPVHQP